MKLVNILLEIRVPSENYFGNLLNQKNTGILVGITKFLIDQYDLYNQTSFDAFFEKNSKNVSVSIKKLNIGQKYIDTDKLHNLSNFDISKYSPVHIYKFRNKLYLHNGHHRLIKVIQFGNNNIKSFVLDIDAMVKKNPPMMEDLEFFIKNYS